MSGRKTPPQEGHTRTDTQVDVVDRLRNHWRAAGQGCTYLCMMCAAADEIERLRQERDMLALMWVRETRTVDAIDTDCVAALDSNPGWRLIGIGNGSGGQTTLTYGWPWPDTEAPR